jgi:hypothetical protein
MCFALSSFAIWLIYSCSVNYAAYSAVIRAFSPFNLGGPYGVQLEYLDTTVLRRGVGEIRVVVGRDPACWQGSRDVCSHWKQTNDLSQHPSTLGNGLGEPLRSFSWTVSSKYYNYTVTLVYPWNFAHTLPKSWRGFVDRPGQRYMLNGTLVFVAPFAQCLAKIKYKLRGLSPRAKYTDRATAVCRRSSCQLLQIDCATWSAWRIPYGRIIGFLDRSRYFFFQVAFQMYSRGWVDPVPDPLLLITSGSAGNGNHSSCSVARNSDH